MTLEFLDPINDKMFFTHMLETGCKMLYNKPIQYLNENEIFKLKKYFHSIGYDCSYSFTIINHELSINVDFFVLDPKKYVVDDVKLERII